MVLSSDRSVGDIGRELGVEWSAIRFGPLTGPLVLRWQAQRAEPHKTAGDEVEAVGLEPTTVLPCKWRTQSLTRAHTPQPVPPGHIDVHFAGSSARTESRRWTTGNC